MNGKKYNGKILLFGEYTIIKGSNALALPLTGFSGEWRFGNSANEYTNSLDKFAKYLEENNKELNFAINISDLKKDLENGLFFNSNIPVGYGAGSSGALVSAVYDKYCKNKVTEMKQLKELFSIMESFFHGKSSGFDPLVCYLNAPVIIKNSVSQSKWISEEIAIAHFSKKSISPYSIFILDTGISRKTEPFVNIFLQKFEDGSFQKNCTNELTIYNNAAISGFVNSNSRKVKEMFDKISRFQYQYFKEMIPESFLKYWEAGLNGNAYKLKLCGAGGGGFILGITENFAGVKNIFKKYNLYTIFS